MRSAARRERELAFASARARIAAAPAATVLCEHCGGTLLVPAAFAGNRALHMTCAGMTAPTPMCVAVVASSNNPLFDALFNVKDDILS